MNANHGRSCSFTRKIKFTAGLLSLLLASLACQKTGVGLNPTITKIPQVSVKPTLPPVGGSLKMVGDWYGPACDEAEGTYLYRRSVNLMEDPDSGQIVGTVKFHDCPGGGRVLYRVVGDPQASPVILLTGARMEGGGALFSSAAPSITFTFDRATGSISPQPISSLVNPGLPMKPVGFLNTGSIAYTVQAQTYLPPGETTPLTPSDASTVAMAGERNSSSFLGLPLGTYTWCYWWQVGDINDDGSLDYRHAFDTRPFLLDENSPDEPETARVVTLSAPPGSGEQPGTCRQP